MSFLDELQKGTNKTLTQNSAATNKSSLNPNLDFFAMAGAMRDRPEDVLILFEKAYHTDKLTAIRILFYLRDIRGGQGERNLFRVCLHRIKKIDNEVYKKIISYVPEYGRWDDLLLDIDESIANIVKSQIKKDEILMEKGEAVSLLAKWMPSENTSSKCTTDRAKKLMKLLDLRPSQYRKKIVAFRKYIKLLEQKMSKKDWGNIEYDKLPSQAFRKHVKAFKRNDAERYDDFIEKVGSGEKKLNTNTLYTYEVFDTVDSDPKAANAMWKNLPNYVEHDALVVADVSRSMSGRPMSISVSLALYFAERNKGLMSGYFMTFSSEPQLIKVTGDTLEQKLRMIQNSNWDMNTDIEAVFDSILSAAVKAGTKQDDMPKVVYIISDMEFDQCSNPSQTIFDNAKEKFENAGLILPHLVFWNVNSVQDQVPAIKFDNNVTLISGASQSTFGYAVGGKTPEESMNDIVNSERYEQITI